MRRPERTAPTEENRNQNDMTATLRVRRGLRRLAVVAGIAALGVAAVAGPASAHVTINPGTAEAGSYARLDLRIPNESDKASTVKLELTLPAEHPFASVRTNPIPGWSVEQEKATLATPLDVHGRQITEAVSKITWTAADEKAGIQPGQFLEFGLSLGPVPDAVGTVLVFKAIQTYSDKTESAWIEDPPAAGGAEPEKPAPTLKIVAAGAGAGEDGDGHADGGAGSPAAASGESGDSGTSDAALWIAIGAGVVALVAVGVAVAGFNRGRRAQG